MSPDEMRAWEKEGNRIKATPCIECVHHNNDCEDSLDDWPHCWEPKDCLIVKDERRPKR